MSNNENIPSNDSQEPNSEAVPFFVRYLEGQLEELSEKEAESISGGLCGDNIKTRKYPSNHEDVPEQGWPMTLKYPSDHEDVPEQGWPMTRKYPSDSDE